MKFSVCGKIVLKGKERAFEKEVEAKSESHAKHIVYSKFGSDNNLPTTLINIASVKKI